MQVRLNANVCDQGTRRIALALLEPLERIGDALSGDYGGTIEHLWIDFDLLDSPPRRVRPFPFRFQKRVSGKSKLTGIDFPDSFNVGHYSVVPDFQKLAGLPEDQIVQYALGLIFESTKLLLDKQKILGGFDAVKFRSAFLDACAAQGHKIER